MSTNKSFAPQIFISANTLERFCWKI